MIEADFVDCMRTMAKSTSPSCAKGAWYHVCGVGTAMI